MKIRCIEKNEQGNECGRQLNGFYTHEGEFKVVCHHCQVEYTKFECPRCHQIVDPRTLQEHHTTPTKTEFICSNCHAIITHEQTWSAVKGEEGWKWKKGICPQCYDERRKRVKGVRTGKTYSFKSSYYEIYRCPACGFEFVG